MSQQENISLFDFQARFSNEEVCQEHLFNIRWKDEIINECIPKNKTSFADVLFFF